MKKRGQIWVETVIYVLIGIIMIGLVLGVAKPRIEELQDKGVIEESIKVMKDIDSTILAISSVSGNQRIVELGIRKGELKIDGDNDLLVFEVETKYEYSEPGEEISEGNLVIVTEEKNNINKVNVTRNYNGVYDITYNEDNEVKTISKASLPYKLTISNIDGVINFEVN